VRKKNLWKNSVSVIFLLFIVTHVQMTNAQRQK